MVFPWFHLVLAGKSNVYAERKEPLHYTHELQLLHGQQLVYFHQPDLHNLAHCHKCLFAMALVCLSDYLSSFQCNAPHI